MNLLQFAQIHKGLIATRYDWELVFGKDIANLPVSAKSPEPLGLIMCEIMDSLHDGDFCRVEPEFLCYQNDGFAESSLRRLDSRKQIEALRMPAKGFCMAVARALGLNVHGVHVQSEDDRLHRLHQSDTPVYLSLSNTYDEVKNQLEKLMDKGREVRLLTLYDWSRKLGSGRPGNILVLPLEHYIDMGTAANELRLKDGVNLLREMDSKAGPPNDAALLHRPEGANYQCLFIVLHTRSLSCKRLPDDDTLECWYIGSKKVRRRAKDISKFVTNGGSFNKAWELLRRYALGHGEIISVKKNNDSTTRGGLKKIMNTVFDQPQTAKPFPNATSKGSKCNFHIYAVQAKSPGDLCNRYENVSMQAESSWAYLQFFGIS